MWRLYAFLGWIVWALTMLASASMNYLAGHQLGRSAEEAQILALLGVVADGWKALGPIFIVALVRARLRFMAAVGALIWVVAFVVAVSAAIGVAAQNRSATVGSRATLQLDYAGAERELVDVQSQRAALNTARSPEEVEADINARLAQPLAHRGTVASQSDACERDAWRTRNECAEIARLRHELATARRAQRLAQRARELQAMLSALRARGATTDIDAQSSVLSRLSYGMLAPADVRLALVLVLAAMIELISAFAPLIVSEYARTRRVAPSAVAEILNPRADAGGSETVEAVLEYIAARLRPAREGRIDGALLLADHRAWSVASGRLPLSDRTFLAAFDLICARELQNRVWKHGGDYIGIAFTRLRLATPSKS
jgi:hypothetical protein